MGKNQPFYHPKEIQLGPDVSSDPRVCSDPKLLSSHLLQVTFSNHMFLSLYSIVCFTQLGPC